jgi:hypothetical protein
MAIDFRRRLERVVSKLGRCSGCMRAARNGSIILWVAVLGLQYAGRSGPISGVVWLAAGAFSLLWLSHAATFTWRQHKTLQRFRTTRSSIQPVHQSSRREWFATAVKFGSAAVFASFVDFNKALLAGEDLPLCSCELDRDCSETGRGNVCDSIGFKNPAQCIMRPKPDQRINGVPICGEAAGQPRCDGICRNRRRTGATWRSANPTMLAGAADLYFQAYLASGASGGPPNAALLSQAMATPLSPDVFTSDAWHVEIVEAVNGILDLTLGEDFLKTPGFVFGEIPSLDAEEAALINAARQGFVEGLLNNSPDAVIAPIRNFWSQGTTYHPLHGGRCYSHHRPNEPSQADCQIGGLQGRLNLLLRDRTAVTAE